MGENRIGKIRLVVVNEHTLAYIYPNQPNDYFILHASILRGATFELHPHMKPIWPKDKIRLASAKDFEQYRHCFKGFDNPEEYEYEQN